MSAMKSELKFEDEVVSHQIKEMKIKENHLNKRSRLKLTISRDLKLKVLFKVKSLAMVFYMHKGYFNRYISLFTMCD